MVLLLWILSLLSYGGFFYLTGRVPGQLNLIAVIVAVIVGLIGISVNNKVLILLSHGLLLLGLLFVFSLYLALGFAYFWAGAAALIVFFATLSLRSS